MVGTLPLLRARVGDDVLAARSDLKPSTPSGVTLKAPPRMTDGGIVLASFILMRELIAKKFR